MGKIVIINGPNLNFLGQREIDKYGNITDGYYAKDGQKNGFYV